MGAPFTVSASGIPAGVSFEFNGDTLPTGYLWCDGSAVSRATYAGLFAAIGTTHGVGDGSTTFNLPDDRGRTTAGKDNMGGSAASRLTSASGGVDGATLGASGGAQSRTITKAQLPTDKLKNGVADDGGNTIMVYGTTTAGIPGTANVGASPNGSANHQGFTEPMGSGEAFSNVQPTTVKNKIIKY